MFTQCWAFAGCIAASAYWFATLLLHVVSRCSYICIHCYNTHTSAWPIVTPDLRNSGVLPAYLVAMCYLLNSVLVQVRFSKTLHFSWYCFIRNAHRFLCLQTIFAYFCIFVLSYLNFCIFVYWIHKTVHMASMKILVIVTLIIILEHKNVL